MFDRDNTFGGQSAHRAYQAATDPLVQLAADLDAWNREASPNTRTPVRFITLRDGSRAQVDYQASRADVDAYRDYLNGDLGTGYW